MLRHWKGGPRWHEIPSSDQTSFSIPLAPSLRLTGLPLLSNAPPYSPPTQQLHPGDNIGLFVERTRTGQQMEHLAQSGAGGMIEVLDGMPAARKILIHINNTNPILNGSSRERAILTSQTIEVAYDGMHLELLGDR